jgi:hypothetical protein
MSKKTFVVHCPNGHAVTPVFGEDQLRADLGAGLATFYCPLCDQAFPLSPEAQANLQRRLDDGSLGGNVD